MCVIVANANRGSVSDIELLQVIETLGFNQGKKQATITLDVLVRNSSRSASSLYVLHPWYVKQVNDDTNLLSYTDLENGTLSTDISQSKVIYDVFSHRISKDSSARYFLERKNCFFTEKDPIKFKYFDQDKFKFSLYMGKDGPEIPPFTVFKISQIEKGNSCFRLKFILENSSYDYFVGDNTHFWVNGPNNVKQLILDKELPLRGYVIPEAKAFFDSEILDHIVTPKAYDVLILQPKTKGVDTQILSDPLSGEIWKAPISNDQLSKFATLYVSRSMDFWIDLCYKGDLRILKSTTTSESYKHLLTN